MKTCANFCEIANEDHVPRKKGKYISLFKETSTSALHHEYHTHVIRHREERTDPRVEGRFQKAQIYRTEIRTNVTV